jgi:hypothetical protein
LPLILTYLSSITNSISCQNLYVEWQSNYKKKENNRWFISSSISPEVGVVGAGGGKEGPPAPPTPPPPPARNASVGVVTRPAQRNSKNEQVTSEIAYKLLL